MPESTKLKELFAESLAEELKISDFYEKLRVGDTKS